MALLMNKSSKLWTEETNEFMDYVGFKTHNWHLTHVLLDNVDDNKNFGKST